MTPEQMKEIEHACANLLVTREDAEAPSTARHGSMMVNGVAIAPVAQAALCYVQLWERLGCHMDTNLQQMQSGDSIAGFRKAWDEICNLLEDIEAGK